MVHLRIVVPSHQSGHALDLLEHTPSACNLIFLERAAQRPEGDVILVDIAREDASVIVSDLKELEIHKEGSIAIEDIDSHDLRSSLTTPRRQPAGLPTDAVVWEEVESRTSENVELSASFLAFMVLATLIAAVGILTDALILIIGAMVVGPEFGPLAGLCVAIVHKRGDLIRRSLTALLVGFPLAIGASLLFTLLLDATGLIPAGFSQDEPPLHQVHLEAGPLHGDRGGAGRRGRRAVADLGQVGGPGRRADLGHDDPRGRQHRRSRRARGQ